MKKQLCTLLCAALVSLTGAGSLLAKPLPASHKLGLTTRVSQPVSNQPTQTKHTQTAVPLRINLPYQGLDSNWTIELTSNTGGNSYTFHTTDGTAYNSVIGSVEADEYTIAFSLQYGRHDNFEFFVGCEQSVTLGYNRSGLVYHGIINPGCDTIIIDAAD
ncbi:MAG: hypothetical protein EOO60_06240 [Hymenobacter sp.]|nr:MAG: hypothetical protein EOO60_06240 [Hymenobacter sp.]